VTFVLFTSFLILKANVGSFHVGFRKFVRLKYLLFSLVFFALTFGVIISY
jgi:hypothetical protein